MVVGGSQNDVTIGHLSVAFPSLKGEMRPSPRASAFNTSVAL